MDADVVTKTPIMQCRKHVARIIGIICLFEKYPKFFGVGDRLVLRRFIAVWAGKLMLLMEALCWLT